MKTKTFIVSLCLLALCLSACAAPVASPTQPPVGAEAPAAAAPAVIAQSDEKSDSSQQSHIGVAPMLPAATIAAPSYDRNLPEASAPDSGLAQPAAPALNDTTFAENDPNPKTQTNYDHLSTFALDVDTASYTVVRKYLEQGLQPDPDAVRPEEFVNYFDQGYRSPDHAAFALYADGAPSPLSSHGKTYLVRFGVKGYDIPDSERKPLTLTFIIDISGSMNMDNRLGLVKRTLQVLVDRLNGEDSVAIVVFGSTARLHLPVTSGGDKNRILNAIYSLETEGSTNAGDGMRLGYETAMSAFRPSSSNRVIFCSDGVANTGLTNPDQILDMVGGYVSEGVYLTTLGFGLDNFNDYLLERLADKGNGNYAYIDTIDEARSLFIDQLTSTLDVIAKDAKIQVDFNSDVVASYRQIGYENRQLDDSDFRNDRVDAGELGPGHSVAALYEVTLHKGAEGRLATLQMRWKDPKTEKVSEINGNLNTWDLKNRFEDTDTRYQLAVTAAKFAEVLSNSPYAEGIHYYQLQALAESLTYKLGDDPDVVEFVRLVDRAASLSNENW